MSHTQKAGFAKANFNKCNFIFNKNKCGASKTKAIFKMTGNSSRPLQWHPLKLPLEWLE